MNDARVKRFTGMQIALHWGQGLLYITLLATGGTILFRRMMGLDTPPDSLLPVIHRGVGIGLVVVLVQMLIAATVTGHLRVLGRDVLDWFLLYPRDVLWLLKAPLSLFWPDVRMPPAGRYNAGQKLHGAFVSLAVTMFILTGLSMMLEPGALAAWIVHAGLFFIAAAFLLVHLFMALVNPATRRSLGGMFTGYVPLGYAESHHPLWLDSAPACPAARPPSKPWKAIVPVALVIAIAVLLAVMPAAVGRLASMAKAWTKDHATEAILPGRLMEAHARATDGNCLACHGMFQRPASSACLACHDTIARAMNEQSGYHGKFTGQCHKCHGEHRGPLAELRPLDANAFNHEQARFGLRGMHQKTSCRLCHQITREGPATQAAPPAMKYIGLTFNVCTDCHHSPHGTTAAANSCTRCHSEDGWDRGHLTFEHSRDAGFVLQGRHAVVVCRSCHTPAARQASAAIAAGSASAPAAESLRVIRPIASQPALARPVPHSTFLLARLGTACRDCHRDPHGGQFKPPCSRCHNADGWNGSNMTFTHGRNGSLVLQGAHATLACSRCHNLGTQTVASGAGGKATAAPLAVSQFHISSTCSSCHDDPHRGVFGVSCMSCHSQAGWTGRHLLFRHKADTGLTLRGAHADLPCTACHDSSHAARPGWTDRNPPTARTCADCHRDPHNGQFDKGCGVCHGEKTFRTEGLKFSHGRAGEFEIDPRHANLPCLACHKPVGKTIVYRPVPRSCAGCHTDVANAIAGRVPQATHLSSATTGPASAAAKPDPHAGRTACTDCHTTRQRTTSVEQYAARCAGCHNADYRNLYFDWSRSLTKRFNRAGEVVAGMRKVDPARATEMDAKIAAAQRSGIHNVQLSRSLLDEVIGE